MFIKKIIIFDFTIPKQMKVPPYCGLKNIFDVIILKVEIKFFFFVSCAFSQVVKYSNITYNKKWIGYFFFKRSNITK